MEVAACAKAISPPDAEPAAELDQSAYRDVSERGGKLLEAVLSPLLASSPEVVALVSAVALATAGAKTSGGPRGTGSHDISSSPCPGRAL